jgi:hypothetical protein
LKPGSIKAVHVHEHVNAHDHDNVNNHGYGIKFENLTRSPFNQRTTLVFVVVDVIVDVVIDVIVLVDGLYNQIMGCRTLPGNLPTD